MGQVSRTAWKRDKLEEELEKDKWIWKKCEARIKRWRVKESGKWNHH